MILRTPRRRISPQTRQRCKAIKGFFKRALGSVSQPDLLQITSSIALNVTDLNHKIVGLEQHLSEVSKLCRKHRSVECRSDISRSSDLTELLNEVNQQSIHRPSSELRRKESNGIYAKENRSKKSLKTDYTITSKASNYERLKVNSDNMNSDGNNERPQKIKKKKSKADTRIDHDLESNFRKDRTESSPKTFLSAYSTSSFHSLDNFREMYYCKPGYSGDGYEKRTRTKYQYRGRPCREPSLEQEHLKKERERAEKVTKIKKSKHDSTELDPDFIADIIKRQYKPVKFGRRHSDLSQFSTPVCRDYYRNTDYHVQEEHKHRNCGGRQYEPLTHHSDCSDIRSVCDARLYNEKRNTRIKQRHRKQSDINEHSEFYDLVPVKEKSSPKSRRKFLEEHMRPACYKEVPPSPRSQRPQLNLNTQFVESNSNIEIVRNRGKRETSKHPTTSRNIEGQPINRNKIITTNKAMHFQQNTEIVGNYNSYKSQTIRKQNMLKNQYVDMQNENSISDSYPVLATEEPEAAVETTFNKTQETVSSHKTDKALCEIKDILQNFLLEIKKEASSSHNVKATGTKMSERNSPPPHDASVMTNRGHSFSNFDSAHCPIAPSHFLPPTLPAFGNPCVYPVMPMCPINCNACLQNRCPLPSPSFTCNNCYDRTHETCKSKNDNKCDAANEPLSCETDLLIKEIYKFVSQSPKFTKKMYASSKEENRSKNLYVDDNKVVTSRSAGGSTRLCRHDAKVGTTRLNCASKSCEAIGARISTEMDSSDTNASYSDTMLEKLSHQTAQSNSGTESSTEPSNLDKTRNSRFSKVLRSFGLRKKIKKDIIEELSESESTVAVEVKNKPPFRQHVTNYAMYDQKYYESPPASPNFRPNYSQEHRPPYRDLYQNDPRIKHSRSHGYATPHPQYQYPTSPPYSQSYDSYSHHPIQPQVPLCLKEVEVKSIGCQSERKMSFFQKITQKMQQPAESTQESQKNGSTQTAQGKPAPLFSWKNPPTKLKNIDPLQYGYETQKKLAFGDVKMRNTMVKKLFHKRNPFSPKNLIIKTLLGKDKSSYGDPPAVFRPKMFF